MEGGEWRNFNAAVCVNEEADFMAQLFPNPNDVNLNYSHHHHYHIIANNTNTNTNNNNNVEGGSSYYSSDSTSNSQNMYRYSQESSYNRNSHDHEVHYQNYFGDHYHHQQLAAAAASNASSLPIDFLQCHMEDHENGAINNDADVDNEDRSELDPSAQDKICNSSYNSKKRSRVLESIQKGKRSVRVKRSQSLSALGGDDDEKENNGIAVNRQSSSSGSLEDDCSSKGTTTTTTSTTTTTTILNSNGKTRASRGSATDPQSLYARKRRERINERLKILQTLVPNGTKVDISTMLEEAVQYVKFLQLQIKLLSSDEHWMYAPIAYNGMNIGLDFQFK